MNNKIIAFACAFIPALLPYSASGFTDKKIIMGSIQFPSIVTTVPTLRVYCGGQKIGGEVDNNNKRFVYSFSVNKYQTYFNILIADDIQFETEENTVKYQKIARNKPYKLYAVELVQEKRTDDTDKKNNAHWEVHEQLLPYDTGRIPDETIIVFYDPTYIDTVVGGNSFELPKILIKKDILKIVGSEAKLHDICAELVLSSLDFEMIYQTTKPLVKQEMKTVVALS